MVENHQVGLPATDQVGEFFNLALSGKRGCVRPLSTSSEDGEDLGARAHRQALDFLDTFGKLGRPEIQAHNDGPVAAARALKHGQSLPVQSPFAGSPAVRPPR